MGTQVILSSPNYSGYVADITFYAQTGGTINFGSHLTPYTVDLDYYYGTYQLCYSAFNSCCQTVIVAPSNTPTNTPTVTPTPSITASATNTPTPTQTATPGATPTQTPSNTATNTPTQTPTNTTTQTPTNTTTQTRTPTQTNTGTPTQTPTNTATRTQTPTNTPTVTPTKSQIYYGYSIRFYQNNAPNTPACIAGTLSNVRSEVPLTVGSYYYQDGPCNVYQIVSSISSSGSYPIIYFQGSAGNCSTAYAICNGG